MSEAVKVYMNGETLADRVNERLAKIKMNKAELALKVGLSRPSVSRYLNNKYESDSTTIEEKLEQFLIDTAHLVEDESNTDNAETLKM